MPSNKKKRGGRQNKQKNNNSGGVRNNGTRIRLGQSEAPTPEKFERIFKKNMKDVPPEEVVERVRQGMGMSTAIIANHLAPGKGNNVHSKCLGGLVDAGLISVVLALLGRCEEEEFQNVIEADGICGIAVGNLKFNYPEEKMESTVIEPGVWIVLILNVVGYEGLGLQRLQDIRMQVANDLGPLIRCMRDDVKQELFKSKQYWFGAIRPFVQLIYVLGAEAAKANMASETIPVLMNYEGLRELMVSCIFWGVHRPDILKDAEPFKETARCIPVHCRLLRGVSRDSD